MELLFLNETVVFKGQAGKMERDWNLADEAEGPAEELKRTVLLLHFFPFPFALGWVFCRANIVFNTLPFALGWVWVFFRANIVLYTLPFALGWVLFRANIGLYTFPFMGWVFFTANFVFYILYLHWTGYFQSQTCVLYPPFCTGLSMTNF